MGGDKIEKTKTDKEKAEVLAEFFATVFTREPLGELPEMKDVPVLSNMEITREEIWKVLNLVGTQKLIMPSTGRTQKTRVSYLYY